MSEIAKFLDEPEKIGEFASACRKLGVVLKSAPAVTDTSMQTTNASPEAACHSQAIAALSKWPVTKGQFQVLAKGKRCLLFLQANSSLYPGKRTAWLIEGGSGELLAEFFAATNGDSWRGTDRGLCSFRGGKFATSECPWAEWMDKADQM